MTIHNKVRKFSNCEILPGTVKVRMSDKTVHIYKNAFAVKDDEDERPLIYIESADRRISGAIAVYPPESIVGIEVFPSI